MPRERCRRERSSKSTRVSLICLPDDVLFMVISCCDLPTLGCLSRVCKRLWLLLNQDCVWIKLRQQLTLVKSYSWTDEESCPRIPVRDECKLAFNWRRSKYREYKIIHHKQKQIPWLQLSGDELWTSYDNRIDCFKVFDDSSFGHQKNVCKTVSLAGLSDVTRFVLREGLLAAASRGGELAVVSADSCEGVWQQDCCLNGEILCVDLYSYNHLVLSGSRDGIVKLWDFYSARQEAVFTASLEDRIWSAAFNTDGQGVCLGSLGREYQKGAGILDVQFDSPSVLLSCGYDAYVRQWDLRVSHQNCVQQWLEPFDSTIYSVKSDGHRSFVTGTSLHGMLRLWDKRMSRSVQLYYAGKHMRSPVYSLAFNRHCLYTALDHGVHALNFS